MRLSAFDPQETSNARSPAPLPYFDWYVGTLLYVVREYEPHRLDAQTGTAFTALGEE
jgi:hypothetical protein